jgi:hypothetical protein
VRFAARDEDEAAANGGVSGFVDEPFAHLEPGSWSALLGSEKVEGPWANWDGLAKTAREGVMARTVGAFGAVVERVPRLSAYVGAAERFDRRNEPVAAPKP